MTGAAHDPLPRPTPLFRELRFRAWVDRVEGRRIMSRAELWDGETLTAEAEGLFVQPRPELAEQYFEPGGRLKSLSLGADADYPAMIRCPGCSYLVPRPGTPAGGAAR